MKTKYAHIRIGTVILAGSVMISALLGLIIGFTYDRFVWVSWAVVVLDAMCLGLAVILSLYFTRYLVGRAINNVLILLLAFGFMLGTGILTFLGFFIASPTAFIYSGNRTIIFLLINLLFFIAINIITSGFAIFQITILKKEKALADEKVLKTQMELKLLTSKINPHFLFNSLNLMVSLLKTPEKAETALINLSEILRYQLDFTDHQTIAIATELDVVEKYLALQQMRFGDRISYSIDCRTTGFIPPMIIQPLVENSIKHNIDQTEHLAIDLTIENEGGMIIRIIDSQGRLTAEMIGRGVGLTVTRKRVEYAGGTFLIKNGGIEISFAS